jgi:hypothetical protein
MLWPYVAAVGTGTAYGIAARFAASGKDVSLLVVMSLAFMALVPFSMGILTVSVLPAPRLVHALLLPILPCLVTVLFSAAIGWEGSICIVMALPIMLLLSIAGGVVAYATHRRPYVSAVSKVGALVLPFALTPVERLHAPPTSLRTVATEIVIAAPREVVWSQIVQVPAIAREELEPSLATRMGFPRPVAATLDHPGVGGVRRATFEGGVLFVETITDWRENVRLRFTIAADTHSIPPTTLDEHVTIGGPYFDVLTGTYSIEPRAGGVVLHLESELRVSTPFNVYANLLADAIMRSIQEQILAVLKKRCERSR